MEGIEGKYDVEEKKEAIADEVPEVVEAEKKD